MYFLLLCTIIICRSTYLLVSLSLYVCVCLCEILPVNSMLMTSISSHDFITPWSHFWVYPDSSVVMPYSYLMIYIYDIIAIHLNNSKGRQSAALPTTENTSHSHHLWYMVFLQQMLKLPFYKVLPISPISFYHVDVTSDFSSGHFDIMEFQEFSLLN